MKAWHSGSTSLGELARIKCTIGQKKNAKVVLGAFIARSGSFMVTLREGAQALSNTKEGSTDEV